MSLHTPPESKPASPSNLTRSGHCDSTPSHNKREFTLLKIFLRLMIWKVLDDSIFCSIVNLRRFWSAIKHSNKKLKCIKQCYIYKLFNALYISKPCISLIISARSHYYCVLPMLFGVTGCYILHIHYNLQILVPRVFGMQPVLLHIFHGLCSFLFLLFLILCCIQQEISQLTPK